MSSISSVNDLKILLLACYELGHQPLSVASPAAALEKAGFSVQVHDLSLEPLPENKVQECSLIALATPMHTALRIAIDAANTARNINKKAKVCFYGLYAWQNREYLLTGNGSGPLADFIIGGEFESPLVKLAVLLSRSKEILPFPGLATRTGYDEPLLERIEFYTPKRQQLPSLHNYTRYESLGRQVQVGYVESSRGCLHVCRHCPVVPVYHGRFFVVPVNIILEDIRQLVKMGAEHITFGDPDFLNGPGHSLKIARLIHDEFPDITFDFTTKVEHIIQKQQLLPELSDLGATFIVSAFESTNDDVLAKLSKGHTVHDMELSLKILEDSGLAIRPTWVPFTPWMAYDDYLQMLDWIWEQGLDQNIPFVQYTIRLLIPPGSALLPAIETESWLGDLDLANFSYEWCHPDPRVDHLHRKLTNLASNHLTSSREAFREVAATAYDMVGQSAPYRYLANPHRESVPHLTEHWFC